MRGNLSIGRYIKWSFTAVDWVHSSPAIGDINNDGMIEVVTGSDGTDRHIYALRGTNGSILWRYGRISNWLVSSPAIGDINGDGRVEVVIGSLNRYIYALRGTNGSLLWARGTGDDIYSSPAIGDIDNDGNVEVVIGSYDNCLYAYRGTNGSLLWRYCALGWVHSSPAIADINNDGKNEVVFASGDSYIYALRGTDGSLLWRYLGLWIMSSPAVEDINGDGKLEVVAGSYNSRIYALSGSDGSLLWSFVARSHVNSSPVVGDINEDGIMEVLAGSYDSTLYCIKGDDGSLIWGFRLPSYYYWLNDIVIADIDPSPGLEVITSGWHTPIYVLSSSGVLLWSMNPVPGQVSISVGDVDGDGCVEIVATGKGAPQVAVIDATSNEGGCGILGEDDELSVDEVEYLRFNDYVEIFTIDGKRIYKGEYKNFKPERKGIYFVVFKEGVKKVVKKIM